MQSKQMNEVFLSYDEKLRETLPDVRVGVIVADVKIDSSCEELRKRAISFYESMLISFKTDEISKFDNINHSRQAYRKLGKDPTKYRVSSEKLIRRVLKNEGIDWINNVVDITNLLSVMSRNSIGTFDYEKIHTPLVFSSGVKGETYLNIGRQEMNLENLPIIRSNSEPVGSTTADSLKTSVTQDTQKIIMCIISFYPEDDLEGHISEGVNLLEEYADGRILHKRIY